MRKLIFWALAVACCATLGATSAALGSSDRHQAALRHAQALRLNHMLVRSLRRSPALRALRRSAVAGTSQTFTDPTGDGKGCVDLTSIAVQADSSSLGFVIGTPAAAQLTADDDITIVFDADANAATGFGGIDFGIVVSGSDDGGLRGAFLKWDGTQFVPVASSLQGAFQTNAGLILALSLSDLGLTSASKSFTFSIGTMHGDTDGDFAPDSGVYTMPLAASVTTTSATTTAATTTTATTTTAAATTTTQKPKPKPKPKHKKKPLKHKKPKKKPHH
jgi:cell division septation protein DedD